MLDDPDADKSIVDSYRTNAEAWTTAVREQQIESRRLCTDEAIIDAVLSRSPKSVIDMGCGEGWLCRTLVGHGVQVLGVDATPGLIAAAQAADDATLDGKIEYRVLDYDAIGRGELDARADAVVCNFSLLGKEPVERLVAAVPSLLNPGGALLVQTLHPVDACGDAPYEEGWREGSWAGFSSAFTTPAPWYFRPMESWQQLFRDNGLRLSEVREPQNPATGRRASVIFLAEV